MPLHVLRARSDLGLSRLGFIGAGQLGYPAVEMLATAGWPMRVYARRAAVRERLAARGIAAVEHVADVADADVLITFLFSDEQLRSVLLDDPTPLTLMRPG